VRLTSAPSRAEFHEIWEPKPPGTLWATPGLLRDSITLLLLLLLCHPLVGRKYILTAIFGNGLSSTGVLTKSLARPGRKQATATEDFDVHISYLLSQLEEY
jgi:hypothetical protein